MTTPRDGIAGLSERLRLISGVMGSAIAKNVPVTVWKIDLATMAEAATAIDALLKERDALQARVKELEQERNVQMLRALKAADRALRAEQERDEAVALLVRVNTLSKTTAWRRMPDGALFSTTPMAGDINAAIRRLAGPEKEGK